MVALLRSSEPMRVVSAFDKDSEARQMQSCLAEQPQNFCESGQIELALSAEGQQRGIVNTSILNLASTPIEGLKSQSQLSGERRSVCHCLDNNGTGAFKEFKIGAF